MAANHHGAPIPPNPELDAIMRRFVDQCEGRAKREYPAGRIGASDDGALSMAVAADTAHGVVRLDFGKPVAWIGMPPEQAVALGEMLIQKAREVSRVPLTVKIG